MTFIKSIWIHGNTAHTRNEQRSYAVMYPGKVTRISRKRAIKYPPKVSLESTDGIRRGRNYNSPVVKRRKLKEVFFLALDVAITQVHVWTRGIKSVVLLVVTEGV